MAARNLYAAIQQPARGVWALVSGYFEVVVAAGADDGVIAVGKRGTGDGPLYASIPGREPIAAQARQEIGAVEATALGGGGGTWLRIKNVTIIGPTLSLVI